MSDQNQPDIQAAIEWIRSIGGYGELEEPNERFTEVAQTLADFAGPDDIKRAIQLSFHMGRMIAYRSSMMNMTAKFAESEGRADRYTEERIPMQGPKQPRGKPRPNVYLDDAE